MSSSTVPQIGHVTSTPNLPRRAGVVVIGGGIAGISTALELAERGVDVCVIEKGQVAAEQSSRNWGWCRVMSRDPREIPLVVESLRQWDRMAERIVRDVGFRRCGIVYLARTQAEMARMAPWHETHAKAHGLSTVMVNAAGLAKYVPGLTGQWEGAMVTPTDARAEPFIAVSAMARYLQIIGGKVFTQCAARGFETSGGRISAVVTEKGVIATDTVVLASGYWSRRFLGNHGISFPQLGTLSSVTQLEPRDIGHTHTFAGDAFAVRKRADGGFTLANNFVSRSELTPAHFRHAMQFMPALRSEWGSLQIRLGKRFIEEWMLKSKWALDETTPFEQVRILDPAPVPSLLSQALASLEKSYPAFAGIKPVAQWGGMIDATPDAVPVIDKVDRIPGLHLTTGYSGHGFGIGPGAGRLMAEIVMGDKPCVDPTPYRFNRFYDGSRLEILAGL